LAIYLKYWAIRHKINAIIATELEFENNKFTGRLATPNCYGIEKTNRVNKYLADNNIIFDYSYGYGNSRGDYELLDFVNEGFFITNMAIEPWVKDAKN
jgi:phosphatidylglycerophosphatase C